MSGHEYSKTEDESDGRRFYQVSKNLIPPTIPVWYPTKLIATSTYSEHTT